MIVHTPAPLPPERRPDDSGPSRTFFSPAATRALPPGEGLRPGADVPTGYPGRPLLDTGRRGEEIHFADGHRCGG